MKKPLRLGLVVEGNATSSSILRMPSLAQELGPIKSRGLPLARRISNSLRAGYAITEYQDLQAARLILLRVPDPVAPRIVEELCGSPLPFEALAFVLCETWLPTGTLEPLRERGSAVASLVAPAASRGDCFIAEGDISAVRHIRRFLKTAEAQTVELKAGTKPLYFAAELLIRALPIPLLSAAQHAMRGSGISGNQLSALLEEMARDMFDTFSKGPHVTWGGPLTECSSETADIHLTQLADHDPDLAGMVTEQLEWARNRLRRNRAHRHSS